MSIENNATQIMNLLYKEYKDRDVSGNTIGEKTGLNPPDINDAIAILEGTGYIEAMKWIGTGLFRFGSVRITSRGKYEVERQLIEKEPPEESQKEMPRIIKPPTPIGSPFGFTDLDWEAVAEAKDKSNILFVVLGYQFESENYNTDNLQTNISKMFQECVNTYNSKEENIKIQLDFKALSAGYGEHLFNEIARDIISSDIAVFETSDLNPNVMIEMGVALTWGVRVLPVRNEKCSNPPSDISGQTWAAYNDNSSGGSFIDDDHTIKLEKMVERAARKKAKNV